MTFSFPVDKSIATYRSTDRPSLNDRKDYRKSTYYLSRVSDLIAGLSLEVSLLGLLKPIRVQLGNVLVPAGAVGGGQLRGSGLC